MMGKAVALPLWVVQQVLLVSYITLYEVPKIPVHQYSHTQGQIHPGFLDTGTTRCH